MKKDNQISEVSLPVPETADLMTKAAQHGVEFSEFLGIQVLAGAYGNQHPEVKAFRKRAKAGINGPETPDALEGGK